MADPSLVTTAGHRNPLRREFAWDGQGKLTGNKCEELEWILMLAASTGTALAKW